MASCRKAYQAVGNSTLTARTKRLWKDYFRDPSQWWDNRKSKANPRSPDFRHRVTKESLWMDGWHNPSWVQDLLKLEKVEEPKTQEVLNQKNNRWEMLSLEEALPSLEEGLLPPPSDEDLACILHKCRKERNLAHALRFCAFMHKSGLDVHRSLGNGLVSMLVEVGSMCHAQQVFDRLVYQDECSWNSLIIGYVRCGEPRHALMLYQKMQENDESLCPSGHTYVALLKGCAKLKDLERGSEIHAEIARKGPLERDAFVNSSLVDMYAKCGSFAKAHGVFDKLPVQDVVSWTALIAGYTEHGCAEEALNYFKQMQQEGISPDYVTFICILKACGILGATEKGRKIAQEVLDKLPVQDVILWNALIAGYAEHGHGEEALNYYKQMEQEGISPDAVTLVCMLKACGSIGAIDKGREVHVEISRKGWERDLFVGSTLVDMYAKCGSLFEAQGVFDKLPVQKVVSWNALMAGYAEHRGGEEALDCFRRMQLEDVSPDVVTFTCCLKACGSTRDIDKGRRIHAEIAREGLEIDLVVGSTLIDMYAKCGLLAKAHEVFDKLPVRDVVSWNALITGYVEHGCGEEALNCFEQMQHEGISPHAVMFICVLKACGSIGAADKGHEIHSEISRKGLERDLVVGSTLVDMYSKCGLLATAQEVFDKLPAQDVVSWNALITGYTNYGCGKEALDCFEQMQHKGVCPDDFTFACILKACGSIGATDKSREIHAEITRKGLERGLFVGSTLVDMYAKCGSPAEAHEAFAKLPVRDVVSWTALMAGYALQLGEGQNVIHVFDRMIREGIEPNEVTFVSVLNACSHAGLVDKGQMYLEAISNAYSFIPTLEHYTCIVDLLGRAGHIDKAVAMVNKMPFHPGSVVWHTVLGACRKWGNVELGRHAFEHAVRLDANNAAAYVCMSNIYADAAMQEDTENVEAMSVKMEHDQLSMGLATSYMPRQSWGVIN